MPRSWRWGGQFGMAIADRLIPTANAAGSEDNTTVVVVSLGEESRQGVWRRICDRVLRWG